MTGRWELGLPKTMPCSLREQAARTILRKVRSQGHTYVELREDGKKFIFFCTLCLAPCYSDSVLFDHLKGSLHADRLSAAKVTLLGPNPWPFNDGVLFFRNSVVNDKQHELQKNNHSRFLEHDNNLAIVKYGEDLDSNINSNIDVIGFQCDKVLDSASGHSNGEFRSCGRDLNGNGEYRTLAIPNVLVKDEISVMETRELGHGQIAVRFLENDGVLSGISRIWCEWMGNLEFGLADKFKVPEHDFAVVTFTYDVELGRKGLYDDVKLLLSSSTTAEFENGDDTSRKRKKSFSDPEDISESLSNQYDSSGEDSTASSGDTSRLLLERYDDRLLHTRIISNKSIRRELRRQQRLAAERMCGICQHKILPGKDVATLLNMKTGRLACSSRNVNGIFHVFHISCLIHWILLWDFEIIMKDIGSPKVRRRSKRKSGAKCNKNSKGTEMKGVKTQIDSVFCPECQGTGLIIDGEELEKPAILLSEMFKYKIKVSDARRAWMKSPEILQNCSTGFHFPCQSQEASQEIVKPLKLLRFYEAPREFN